MLDTVLPPRRPAIATAALAALDGALSELRGDERELAATLAERAEQHERAGHLFASIGQDAFAAGALASAANALRRATELLRPGEEQTDARLALVEALAHAGRVDEALAVSAALTPLHGMASARAHLSLARAAMAATRWELAAAELDTARASLEGEAGGALRAQLAVREAELAIGTGDLDAATERARAALDEAQSSDAADVACEALLVMGRVERVSSLERAREFFAEAAARAKASQLRVWELRALHELGTIDLLDRGGSELLLRARQLAGDLGALATAAVIDLELCAAYNVTGDLDAARQRGVAAAEQATTLGQEQVAASAYILLASTYLELGERQLCADACTRSRALARGDAAIEGLLVLASDGIAGLVDERREDALVAFDCGMTLLRDVALAAPASMRGLWPLLLAVERDERAPAAIEEVQASGVSVNRLNLGYLLFARAALVGKLDPAAANALATEGDEHLAHSTFWRHIGRRLLAEAAAADGWDLPGPWAADAASFFAANGHNLIAAASRRFAGGPPEATWALAEIGVTRREAEVLLLVHEGLTNKELAERLYVSPRTVEKHIESLLRKTGARTRTQLAAYVARSS